MKTALLVLVLLFGTASAAGQAQSRPSNLKYSTEFSAPEAQATYAALLLAEAALPDFSDFLADQNWQILIQPADRVTATVIQRAKDAQRKPSAIVEKLYQEEEATRTILVRGLTQLRLEKERPLIEVFIYR